jgi:peptidoglycan/LPS O-acetylase OafA/YrhL
MTAATLAQPRTEIRSLQVLRLLAAVMVVIGHVLDILRRGHVEGLSPITDPTRVPWHSGVDIFFVVSGFVMYFLMAGRFGEPGVTRQFLWRRLVRIAPLYWIFTILTLATMLIIPGQMNNNIIDLGHVVASFAFIPWPAPSGDLTPILSVGWTLNFEMLFYGVFALALMFPRKIGLSLLAFIFALLILNTQFGYRDFPPLTAWGFPIILEFLFGIGLAALYLGGVRIGLWVRLTMAGLGVGLLILAGHLALDGFDVRWYAWGIPGTLIVAAFVLGQDFSDTRLTRILVVGGNASYALYLSHLFTLRGFGLVWEKVGWSSPYLYAMLAVVASIAVSVMVHLYLETPILNVLRGLPKRLQRRKHNDA